MTMNIEATRADLKARQETVVNKLNETIEQKRALQQLIINLTEECQQLNGEKRMLDRLEAEENGKKKKDVKVKPKK